MGSMQTCLDVADLIKPLRWTPATDNFSKYPRGCPAQRRTTPQGVRLRAIIRQRLHIKDGTVDRVDRENVGPLGVRSSLPSFFYARLSRAGVRDLTSGQRLSWGPTPASPHQLARALMPSFLRRRAISPNRKVLLGSKTGPVGWGIIPVTVILPNTALTSPAGLAGPASSPLKSGSCHCLLAGSAPTSRRSTANK